MGTEMNDGSNFGSWMLGLGYHYTECNFTMGHKRITSLFRATNSLLNPICCGLILKRSLLMPSS